MMIYTRNIPSMFAKWSLVLRRISATNSLCLLRCSYTSGLIETQPILNCEKCHVNSSYKERKLKKDSQQSSRKIPKKLPVLSATNNAQTHNAGNEYINALPTDMSAVGALDLLTIPSGISYLHYPLISPRKNNDSLYKFEKLIFQILRNNMNENSFENNTHLNEPSEANCSNHKQGNKDLEPADDPKQKIRLLHNKLRQQLPMYFSKGSAWHDFSIYKPSVQLIITPKRYRNKITFRGISSYKRIATLYRKICKFCLREPRLEVLSLTSFEDKKFIEVRWRTVGMPYFQILGYIVPALRRKYIKYYDYASVLHLDEDCKVYCHEISKLQSHQQPLRSIVAGLRKSIHASAMTPIVGKDTMLNNKK